MSLTHSRDLLRRRLPAVAAAALAGLALPALAQSTFNEVESNNTRATANVIANVAPGDMIVGNSIDTSAAATDFFKATMAPTPSATVYRYRGVLTSPTPGHNFQLRGYNQTTSGITTTSDGQVQQASTSANPRYVQWYGFGKEETAIFRVTGVAATTANYTITIERTAATIIDAPSTINAGTITIAGTSTDNTDLWIYDDQLNPKAGFGNDNGTAASGGPGAGANTAVLRRLLLAGTYYVAVGLSNVANNQASPSDDGNRTGQVWEGAGAISSSSTATTGNASITISDGVNPAVSVPLTVTEPYQVFFVRFQVVGDVPPSATVSASPNPTTPTTSTLITAQVTPSPGANNAITSVTANLASLGGSAAQALNDSGLNGDATAGDNTWSYSYAVPYGVPPGNANVNWTVVDASNRSAQGLLVVGVNPIQPNNDSCGLAQSLTDAMFPLSGSTGFNLATIDDATSCDLTPENGIWFTYTAAANGILEMRETGGGNGNWAVFAGCGGSLLYCESTDDEANFLVTAGQTYAILLYNGSSASTNANDTFVYSFRRTVPSDPPSNDTCAGALDLTGAPLPYVQTVDVSGATPDVDVSCNATLVFDAPNGVWFKYSAEQDVALEIAETSSASGFITVYDGCGGAVLACRSLANTTAARNVIALPGGGAGTPRTYAVLVSRNRQGAGVSAYDLSINFTPLTIANRNCEGATEITGAPFLDTKPTAYLLTNGPTPSCLSVGSSTFPRSVLWYKYTPARSTVLTYDTHGATSAAAVIVYAGSCGALTEYYCSSTFSTPSSVAVALRFDAGQTYYIAVYRYASGDPAIADQSVFRVREASVLPPVPANDACANATQILSTPFERTVHYAGANPDFRASCPTLIGTNPPPPDDQLAGVWYSYHNGLAPATAIVQTYGPEETFAKSAISAFVGCPTDHNQSIACDEQRDNAEYISFAMQPNTTYHVKLSARSIYRHVAPFADEFTNIRFDVVPNPLPTVGYTTCATARPVPALPFRDTVFSAGLPTEPADVTCNTGTGVPNAVWYSYTTGPADSGYLVFNEVASQASGRTAIIGVFSGCPADGGTQLQCASIAETGVVQAFPSTTYYFLLGVSNAANASNPAEFWDFRLELVPNATNDLCSSPKDISNLLPYTETVSEIGLTNDTVPVNECFSTAPVTIGNGVWYKLVARDNFIFIADELGPNFASRRFAMYKVDPADPCNQALWTNAGCSFNAVTGPINIGVAGTPVMMSVEAGSTYYIVMGHGTLAQTDVQKQFYSMSFHTVAADMGRCSTGQTCAMTIRQNCTGTFLPGAGPCKRDYNCQNGVDLLDIFAFLNDWFAGNPKADYNGMFGVDLLDIFAFLGDWFMGPCP